MDRRFLTVWFGQSASTFGTRLSGFGSLIWVFSETGSIGWVAVLTFAMTTPALVASPFLGFVDRFDRRRVMLLADTGAGLTTAAVVVAWLLAEPEPWWFAVAWFISGLFAAFQVPAYAAALPSLLPDAGSDALGRANGLVQLGPGLGFVAAPGVAGLLLAGPGIGAVFLVDLLTFALAVVTLLMVRFRSQPEPTEEGRSLLVAVKWLWREARPVMTLIAMLSAANLLLGVFNVGVVARGFELGGEAGSGLAPTAGGLGALAVGLLVGLRGLPKHRIRAAGWSVLGLGFGLGLASTTDSLALFVICVGVGLAGGPLVQAVASTTIHERVPPNLHGRVFGLRNTLAHATHPVGSAIAGILVSWSVVGSLAAIGALLVALGLAIRLGIGSLRHLDIAAPSGAAVEAA